VKKIIVIIAIVLAAVAAGCGGPGKDLARRNELDSLRLEKSRLENEIRKAQEENAQFKEQFRVLSGVEKDVEIEKIYDLKSVRLTKYTNLYDKDDDGDRETLIVYLQPVDNDGDIVKAAGAVDVQLWDLSKEAQHAMLGQWRVEPDELKKLWYNLLLAVNYRLAFDAGEDVAEFKEPLTVKVTFTDYVTGKVFKEQRVIKP
jgi:hypothetical protein